MKAFILLFLVVLVSNPVFSQKERGYVYLKNGTIIKGRYEKAADGKLRVESGGNLWVFESGDIDSIASGHRIRNLKEGRSETSFPLFFRTELGFLVGNPDNSQDAPLSITGSVNYRFLPFLSGGAGLGTEFFKETYMPLFINLEYALKSSLTSPFLFLKTGYQLPLEESREVYYDVWPAWNNIWPGPAHLNASLDPTGGFLANAGIGYSGLFPSGFGMSVAFGYQFHRLGYTGDKDYRLQIDYNRMTIKMGFVF